MITYYCPKCENEVSRKPEDLKPSYFARCLNCNDNFYMSELLLKNTMATVKGFRDTLRAKELGSKNGQDMNKIIFFNMILSLNDQKRLTEAEKQTLINSAILINELYK